MSWFVALLLFINSAGGATWGRDANATLYATQDWEGGAVMEPAATWDSAAHLWRLYYTANERAGGLIGYATATTLRGPWTKFGPVVGLGYGGVKGTAAQSFVVIRDGGFVMYISSLDNEGDHLLALHSADGYAWSLLHAVAVLPAGFGYWGNKHVWSDATGWHALFEAGAYPPAEQWHVFYWSSPDGLRWTQEAGPYRSLAVAPAARTSEGGAFLFTHSAPYVLYFHAGVPSGPTTPQGVDLFMATTDDLMADHWKVTGPILQHSGTGSEINAIGDPHVFVVDGRRYMLYDAEDDARMVAAIELAVLGETTW